MTTRRSRFSFGSRRGSIVLVALCLTAVVGIATTGFITACYRSAQLSNRTFNLNRSTQFAEMGMEEALWSLRNDSWTADWTISGATATRTITGFAYPDGCTGEIHIVVQNRGSSSPTLIVEGQTTLGDGSKIKRQLTASASRAPVFTNAIFSSEATVFNHGGTVDSYNSTTAPYDAAHPGASAIVAGKTVSGYNANIRGYVITKGNAPSFNSSGTNGTVRGPVASATTTSKVDPSRLGTSPYQNLPDIKPVSGPSVELSTPLVSMTLGTPGNSTPSIYRTNDFHLTGAETITIAGPVIINVQGAFTIDSPTAGIVIAPTGSLELHFSGDLLLDGNGIVNQTLDPKKLALLGTGATSASGDHTFSTTTPFHGVIYLPAADLTLTGNVEIHGAILARSVTFSGGDNPQVHYDASLRSATADFDGLSTSFQLNNWREITHSDELTAL